MSDKNRADRIPYGNAGLFDDPWLEPFVEIIQSRLSKARKTSQQFTQGRSWQSAADYHNRFGLHRSGKTWVFREWAPNATGIFILCPANQWKPSDDWALTRTGEAGIFEGRFPEHCFAHKGLYRLWMVWDGGESDRIPTAATRVVQDPGTLIFNAQVWAPNKAYHWQTDHFIPPKAPLLVYEAHPGMALEEGRIGTWVEFAEHLLPKIVHAGYNTLLLMAVQEHPYYGSFGYHVSSFFAPSSRFGTPDDLKYLIDMAHGMDIRVLVDIVHSHSVKNEVEGLSRFDGTDFQFFHGKDRGHHKLWDSRCFDYGKPQVLNFLLSNLRFFMEEFRVDGFRFDGVTSMLFHDHGLGRDFTRYADYFGDDVDQDALNYLFMANDLVHSISSRAITIAEDVSGYPGLAAPKAVGGTGFDLRFAMGIADMWIRLLKEVRDEDWHLGTIWFELIRHRTEEKTISYVECHDQALVGDQTLMMRLMGERIYTGMQISDTSAETLRAVALHKMIRLVTLGTAHKGYLTFMGNEFGHPEWVDFPSPGNGYSYTYARRQWSLKYDPTLYYCGLFEFDRQMIALAVQQDLFSGDASSRLLYIHEDDKILAFQRQNLIFIFNFHPAKSFNDYRIDAPAGKYEMILDTDEKRFCGMQRLTPGQIHFTVFTKDDRNCLSLYLPSRCAMVLIYR